MKWGNSKQEKFSNDLVSKESSCLTVLFGGHSPIQRQKTNSKMVTTEKLSKSGLGRCAKFGEASSNDEQKITLSLILHFIRDFWI